MPQHTVPSGATRSTGRPLRLAYPLSQVRSLAKPLAAEEVSLRKEYVSQPTGISTFTIQDPAGKHRRFIKKSNRW